MGEQKKKVTFFFFFLIGFTHFFFFLEKNCPFFTWFHAYFFSLGKKLSVLYENIFCLLFFCFFFIYFTKNNRGKSFFPTSSEVYIYNLEGKTTKKQVIVLVIVLN